MHIPSVTVTVVKGNALTSALHAGLYNEGVLCVCACIHVCVVCVCGVWCVCVCVCLCLLSVCACTVYTHVYMPGFVVTGNRLLLS